MASSGCDRPVPATMAISAREPVSGMFETVLVANRGEIAVRVIRTLREMGIRSVAVHSDADAGALHTRLADVAVPIGPAPAAQSYLSIERVLEAAARTGAQAIHPGYGFLSENVEFARACEKAGIVFIGPPVAAIEAMGDKIRAKQTVMAAGVPVVPGPDRAGHDRRRRSTDAAVAVGFPVLLKPSAGGGGKGMRVVRGAGRAARRDRRRPPRGRAAPSATTPCWSSGTSGTPGTSRCRCSATRTAT